VSRSRFPFHLRSSDSKSVSACGNLSGVNLLPRSIKRVTCKNCLKIIERGAETAYFKPSKRV
jgi:RNase P subunit RPR2